MSAAGSPTPAFSVGDRVLVRNDTPPHHHRTPWYVKARRGRVVACIGAYLNSETRAHGGSGLPALPMYRVEFDQSELWPGYAGSAGDRLWIDLYEHWLAPA